MRSKQLARLILGAVLCAGNAQAATTEWLSKAGMRAFGAASPQTKFYPTAIECRLVNAKPRFRVTYKTFTEANKPFHKWQWVHGKADELAGLVAKIPLKDRPELKYRIVAKSTYQSPEGKMGCAVAYR